MQKISQSLKLTFADFKIFSVELLKFISKNLQTQFIRFEVGKNIFVVALYRQRGKMAKRLMHSGMAGITALGVMIAPIVAQEFPENKIDPWEAPSPSSVLSASTSDSVTTDFSEKQFRDRVIEYQVEEGDTVSSIAQKFDISVDTIRWQNNLKSKDAIKVGQTLQILPVTGVSHKVQKGDTVYSIAKKYDTEAQNIVNFPFNTYVNDETFELAIGQSLVVPDGVKQEEIPWSPTSRIKQITPDAGTVVASGQFVWPAAGQITQQFVWYHRAIDIANKAAPAVLAADSGTVIVAGWPDGYGYGNRIIIDHGNGTRTLYAHLQKIYVVVGQTVARGNAIGQMGSTGRSTGPHLHFEVIKNGAYLNPLGVLR
jgi:murein DD-endopeptidase MepM/ murein hydrolase activator NlpD